MIKNLLEDLEVDVSLGKEIPIPNVNEPVLRKVLEWCDHHKDDPPAAADDETDARKKTTDIEDWDMRYMQVDQEMLFEIILVCFVYLFTQQALGLTYNHRLQTT